MKITGTVKKVLENSGWMIGQQVYFMILSLVIGSLSARYLGPSNYGLINYGASLISFFTIISKLGLDGVIINEMIKLPEKQGDYLGVALVMRLVTSIISLFAIVIVVRIIEPNNDMLYVITLLQSFAIILQSYEVFTYWFQLNLKMKYVSIAMMIAQTVAGIWRIGLLVIGASVYWFALSTSIQYIFSAVVVILFFRREKEKNLKLHCSIRDGKALLCKSYHFIISGLAITLYMQIDKIMIGKIISNEAVGIYTAATTIAALWEFVPTALVNSARPVIIKKYETNHDEYLKRFQQLLLIVSLMSIFVSVGMMLLGKIAVCILYGIQYIEATAPLYILIWSTGFAMIGTVRSIWIVAEGYNKYSKYYILIGAAVNMILNIILISVWGITGAAIATLIAQFVVALIAPLFFSKTRAFVKIYFNAYKQIPAIFRKLKV